MMSHRDAGRLGGISTYMRYGPEHMKATGRLGGRPKLTKCETVGSRKKKEEMPRQLSELRRAYRSLYEEEE